MSQPYFMSHYFLRHRKTVRSQPIGMKAKKMRLKICSFFSKKLGVIRSCAMQGFESCYLINFNDNRLLILQSGFVTKCIH